MGAWTRCQSQQSRHDGQIHDEILSFVGLAQSLIYIPKVMHKQINDNGHARKHQGHGPGLPTQNQGSTAANL